MIKKEHRLKKNRHFNYIYSHGMAKHTTFLSLAFVKTKYQPYKVGFTVSKKVGKSVVRSLVKRRLRECFNQLEYNFDCEHNYIFIAREGIDKLTFLELKAQMLNLIKKAGCYRSEENS